MEVLCFLAFFMESQSGCRRRLHQHAFSFFSCSRQSWTQTRTLPNIYRRLVPGDPDPGRPYTMDGYALIAKTYALVRVTPSITCI